MRPAVTTSSLFLIVCFCNVYGYQEKHSFDSSLELALKSWNRYTDWNGPVRVVVKKSCDSCLKPNDDRILDPPYYLRRWNTKQNGGERTEIAIRNSKYAAWLIKDPGQSTSWWLAGMYYAGGDGFGQFSREADAPWVVAFNLPLIGNIGKAIDSSQLKLAKIEPIDRQRNLLRFFLEQNLTESQSKWSSIEVDASPDSDWFPHRVHRVWKGESQSDTWSFSDFVETQGFVIPRQIAFYAQNSDGSETRSNYRIALDMDVAIDPKECSLEFYGLGEVEVPAKRVSRISLPLVVVVLVIALLATLLAVWWRSERAK